MREQEPGTAIERGTVTVVIRGAVATGNVFGSTNPALTALKAWFFFDDGWVALGANITSAGTWDVPLPLSSALPVLLCQHTS